MKNNHRWEVEGDSDRVGYVVQCFENFGQGKICYGHRHNDIKVKDYKSAIKIAKELNLERGINYPNWEVK